MTNGEGLNPGVFHRNLAEGSELSMVRDPLCSSPEPTMNTSDMGSTQSVRRLALVFDTISDFLQQAKKQVGSRGRCREWMEDIGITDHENK